MQFPDLVNAVLTPYQEQLWLNALLAALGEHADELVTRLPNEIVRQMLYYLYNALNEAEADPDGLGESWRRLLRLD